jgi:predicted DCC family thiol-disulfide oxidoreductase YuxK
VPADKPILIWDGTCGFCRIWVDYWRRLTGDRIEYLTSQEVGGQFPQIPPEAYREAVQLVRPDGTVASGALAVFESLGMQTLYAGFGGISELAYRFIARHRNFFYQVTRFTFGTHIEPTRFEATQWIFVRLLAIIYAIAFGSLAVQVTGLIGSRGILPLPEFLNSIAQSFGKMRFLAVPSVFWMGADDTTLTGLCYGGLVLAALLFVTGFRRGRFERFILVLLFVLYLSFSAAGQDFLSFQWDSLLLEAGFLAIFLGRTRIVPWLFRWLVFRLIFLSGAVKLLSEDKTWRNLSALDFHYYTQPLPTVLAWYADKLPMRFQHFSTWLVLATELGIPFWIFMPRRIRIFAAWWLITLQVLIFLTGNYTFFNLLTIALCVFLFDDYKLERFVPQRVRQGFGQGARPFERAFAGVVAAVILVLGVARLMQSFSGIAPEPLAAAITYTAPFQIVNNYGLFAVMTTERNEIIIEGSEDGEKWVPYEFRYKPGDVNRAPRWVQPHQPRLDWQMWFAALGSYRTNPWIVNLAVRLLDGSPSVPPLLANNPFPQHPPRFVRATVYRYTFTDFETRRRTGAWWKREPRGLYLPAVGLRSTAPN